MQSKSAPKKKTSKASLKKSQVESAADSASKSRVAKSSKPEGSKFSEPTPVDPAGSSAKRHRKLAAAPQSSDSQANTPSFSSQLTPTVSEDAVRELAYHYWVERGRSHGSHHEDWIRAEQALSVSA